MRAGMGSESVGAGDIANYDGIVKCADCRKKRDTGVGRFYCDVFFMVVMADEKRQCTAFLPVDKS